GGAGPPAHNRGPEARPLGMWMAGTAWGNGFGPLGVFVAATATIGLAGLAIQALTDRRSW
ncbi:MAG: hypothetical protein L0Z62_04240, partial [Gemmataceae bacterium]|nr:hypothetical protein [Gemmataceae bacterium]